MSPDHTEVEVDGQHLTISNLDKVLYPETGFTKGQLLDYYSRIAPVMTPHLAGRPVTLRRAPGGVNETIFFEKHAPARLPGFVHTVRVQSTPTGRARTPSEPVDYALVADRATLVWAANLATIEFHVPLWRADGLVELPGSPDHLVFDLDPGPGTTVIECCVVASWIGERLAEASLGSPLPKTSGSKGLQVYVRLGSGTSWDEARARALELAQAVERDHPELVVTNMRKELRRGKVLIDWSQVHPAKTTVAVYSLRALPAPTASTPVTWSEMVDAANSGDPNSLRFVASEVLERVERHGDLFAPLIAPPQISRSHHARATAPRR